MAKPRKSTLDAFVDQFCEFTVEAQERALDLMNFEHRRAKIRAGKKSCAPGQPAVTLLDGQTESEAIR